MFNKCNNKLPSNFQSLLYNYTLGVFKKVNEDARIFKKYITQNILKLKYIKPILLELHYSCFKFKSMFILNKKK